MAQKFLKLTVGPSTNSEEGTLEATFSVSDLQTSLPATVYSGQLSDGTPVEVQVVEGPKLGG